MTRAAGASLPVTGSTPGLVRRSTTFVLRYREEPTLDIAAMLRGSLSVEEQEQLVAFSMLTGETRALDSRELAALDAVPSRGWTSIEDVSGRTNLPVGIFESLRDCGLLIGSGDDGAELRTKEEAFLRRDWDPDAAQYHLMSRNRDEDVGRALRNAEEELPPAAASSRERIRQYVELSEHQALALAATSEAYHDAPPHFHSVPGVLSEQALPLPRPEGRLFDLLRARKTVRVFDDRSPMTADELSTLLYYTYGCHGYAPLVPGLVGLRKTSPSGGALHPIEVYPLILNVEGVATGFYHYSVERHALELLQVRERSEAEDMAELFLLGQSYFKSAHVLFVLTARWYRNFFKYRRAQKSYRVIHVDAGHLSQTLYLLCEEMGLGAFYSGAINDVNIEEALGLDPLEEGAIGISGCGRPVEERVLSLQTIPYVPRETRIG